MGMLQGPAKWAVLRDDQVLYLALADLEKKWERSIRDWSNVLGQFAVFFKDRLPNL